MLQQEILAVVLSVLLANILKAIIHAWNGEAVRMFHLGGMPSAHSATVSSLFFVVYYETGASLFLLIVAVFGWLVIRDAFGVRWEVSKHSIALNKLVKKEEFGVAGHTKLEVLAGVLLGFVVTVVVYLI